MRQGAQVTPVSLPLFQGRRLDAVEFSVSCMVMLLSYGG